MPLWRTRSIGMQFYKYDIAGFLQWGYNFYSNCHSVDVVEPFMETTGDYWVSGGDTHSVYPAQDGTAMESIRILSFYEALQDRRAMDLAGQLCGTEKVVEKIEKIFGKELRFDTCAKDSQTLLAIREAVNAMIKEKL